MVSQDTSKSKLYTARTVTSHITISLRDEELGLETSQAAYELLTLHTLVISRIQENTSHINYTLIKQSAAVIKGLGGASVILIRKGAVRIKCKTC
jgi:hypothetical protein